jgi:hypothetical protein
VLKLTKTPIIPGQLASQSFHRAEHVTPKTSIPLCFAISCFIFYRILSNQPDNSQTKSYQISEPKPVNQKNQMSELKNQQHFKTSKSKNQMSEPKRPYQYNNLTTCKLCFTSIILHANFKQKPKFVLEKKKEKEEFKHHYERLPRKEMSFIELDEIPNPRKNLYPRLNDLKAQAFGYWLLKI